MKPETSAKFTLWVNRFIILVLIALAFLLPTILRLRLLGPDANNAIAVAFYCCFPVVLYALYCIDRLMRNILSRQVFILANVRYIRRIRWCCVGVSVICLPASVFYLPLIFMVVIMAFLALVVSVLKSVMAAAVEIREENDLTV